MKTSARNMIKGKVKEVKKGAVNSIVISRFRVEMKSYQ